MTQSDNNNDRTNGINPYGCWLAGINGVGTKVLEALYRHVSCAEEIYDMDEQDLELILTQELSDKRPAGKTAAKKAELITQAHRIDPMQTAAELMQRGIGFTCIEDTDYPARLRSIPDRPFAMYYIGKLPEDDAPAVAIVGARNCSGYGREQARRFAQTLALRGVNVISGMARGVDGIAGRAAAEAAACSYAVLGCGVDVPYPKENRELYYMLAEHGGILSEYVPGTQPKTQLFPKRNRLISGLADAVLVVESRLHSGTQITVDAALEQGREIFALPGRVGDLLSEGCNQMIKQGAGIACSPDDILEFLFGVSEEFTDLSKQQRLARQQRGQSLPPVERALFEALECGEIMEIDYLWHRAEQMLQLRLDISEVMAALMQLQIKGMAVAVGLSHYKGI